MSTAIFFIVSYMFGLIMGYHIRELAKRWKKMRDAIIKAAKGDNDVPTKTD